MSKIVKLNLWELAGNEDTNSTEDYIGTTDGEPLTIQLLGDDTKIEGRTYAKDVRIRSSNNLSFGGTGASDQSVDIQALLGSLSFTFQNGSFNEGFFISGNDANGEVRFDSSTSAKFRFLKNSFLDEGNQTKDELSTTGVKIMSGYTQTHPNFSLDTEVEIEGELLVI